MRLLLLHSSATSCFKEPNKASFAALLVTDHSAESTYVLCPYKPPQSSLSLETTLNRELITTNCSILQQRSCLQ